MNGSKIYVLHRSKTEIHMYEVRSLRTVGMSRAVGGVNKDILNYTYTNGNQLGNVTDAGDITSLFKGKAGGAGYTYDANGNMTADGNKDLTISYNYLNLPGTITRTAGATGYVKNYYAGATKIRSVTYTAATNKTKTYDYMAGMVYAQADAGAPKTLDFVATPEGRAMSTKTLLGLSAEPLSGDKFRYEYNLKDHLGNLRVSCRCDEIKRDANGLPYPETDANYGFIPLKAVQEIAYDPWGLNFGNTTDNQKPSTLTDRYQYNGKEKLLDLDLGWSDYGARMYMNEIGRWGAVDPLAELDYNFSAYTYVYNNPLGFVDHFGMHPDSAAKYSKGAIVENNTGSWTYLGDGQWQTNWVASSSIPYYPILGMDSYSSGTSFGPSYGNRNNSDSFSWSDYLNGVNQRSGLVAAGGSLLKNYPSLYRDAGKFTTQYWSKVKMLGKSFQVANKIDKIANLKVKGLPGLGIVNAGIEALKIGSKYYNGESVKASDVGGALFNSAIGFLAFSNPVTATAMPVYVIADYSGVLDPAKAVISQTVDNAFQK